MTTQAMTVGANPREDFGKNAARRMRRGGRVPAVVYGGGGPAIPVAVDLKQVEEILNSDSGHNAIFALEIPGKTPTRVMIREWQVDPVRGGLLHVDLVRIARDEKLKVKVPVHVVGEAKGVKVQGGIFEFMLREVELECLPDDIPEYFTADVTELTIGRNLRVSDLPIGPNVKVLTDLQRVVAHVVALRAEEEVKPVEEVVAAAAPAEPEVIRKGKPVEEGAEEAAPEGKKEAKEGKKEGKEGKKEGKEGKKESKKES